MARPTIRVGLFGFGRAGKAVAEEIIRSEQTELIWVATRSGEDSNAYVGTLLGQDLPAEGRFISTRSLSNC